MELDLAKINDSDTLLDILIGCENVLDSADLYCHFGWINGEVIAGPIVSRYWVKITLRYDFDEMPDPRAALRLLKIGVQVEFDRVKRATPRAVTGQDHAKRPDEWLVKLTFPRRLLDQNEKTDLEMYDDEVNPDDVTDAQDDGLDDDTTTEPGAEDMDGMDQDQGMGQPPGMGGPPGQPPPRQ